MKMYSVNKAIQEIFEAHGLETTEYKEWILINGNIPAIRASYTEPQRIHDSYSIRLDVEIALGGERLIYEGFSGIGKHEDEAVKNGMLNFVYSSLHVLLTGVWDVADDADQVLIETWNFGETDWKVIIGNFISKSFGGVEVSVPENLLNTIEHQIKRYHFTEALNWVRMFYCNISSQEQVSEFLINNEIEEHSQRAIASLGWAKENEYYSVRNFLILKKINPG